MGGLAGAWGRIHEDRQRREIAGQTCQYYLSRSLEPDRMTGVNWLLQIAILKRWCRVHSVNDRCWRKPKEVGK